METLSEKLEKLERLLDNQKSDKGVIRDLHLEILKEMGFLDNRLYGY